MSSGGQDAKLFARVSTSYLVAHFHFSVMLLLEDIRAMSLIIVRQKSAARTRLQADISKKTRVPSLRTLSSMSIFS